MAFVLVGMRGGDRFTAEEISWIGAQIAALRRAERDEQKRIRAGLRRFGFRISDWATDAQGFTVSDFDLLVRRGMIKSDATAGNAAGTQRHGHVPHARKRAGDALARLNEGEWPPPATIIDLYGTWAAALADAFPDY